MYIVVVEKTAYICEDADYAKYLYNDAKAYNLQTSITEVAVVLKR